MEVIEAHPCAGVHFEWAHGSPMNMTLQDDSGGSSPPSAELGISLQPSGWEGMIRVQQQ